ncbi:MAG: hypothetical protein K9J81_05740 [Desulfohalobiaceae bacterium]|nr:hypothetical protein [Desulfohalobiaceae bacterium]
MSFQNVRFQYLKSTRGAKTPDYLIQEAAKKLVVEIGGLGRGRSQFKGVKYDRKIVFADVSAPGDDRFPLFLLGYLS